VGQPAKGTFSLGTNIGPSVLDSAKALGGVKKIDLFEPARLDGVYSVEEVAQSLKTLVDEGLISYIGLSEVNADTLRRACKVMDIPISVSQRADQVKRMIGYSNSRRRD
jgi:aryl-alcohol dehydrogenase-like predicted oxidoreductase